ncbi:MAG TPA: LysR family transcriptional regulator [Polyangiaceae bacterium]|nr:LysR family transcriptional regulator [Polyangiaceae bacterium]
MQALDPALIPALYDVMIVARTGSVALAARRLNKTPSAVSQQIRRIADVLGVPLFERHGRGLRLTAAAEQVLPAATRLFDEAEAVFRLFGELSGAGVTTLRIAASDYLAKPLLVPVLRDLAHEQLPLHFEISTVHSEEALTRLERGDVEMAIATFQALRPGVSAIPLFEQAFYWIGPERLGRRRSLVERLTKEPLLRLGPGSFGRKLLDDVLERRGIRPVSTIDVPSVSLLLAYATGGVGIGLVPALPLETRDIRGAVLELAEVPRCPVQLVTRAGPSQVKVVQRFVERLLTEASRQRARLETNDAARR